MRLSTQEKLEDTMIHLSKLIMLSFLSIILPLTSFAHPDFSRKRDVQKVLQAILLTVDEDTTPNNNKNLRFSDGRTYTVTIQKNFVFGKVDETPKLVVRFEKAAELLQLLTLEARYTPKLKTFSKWLEVLEEAIAHNNFKLKLAVELAKDSKAFDEDKFGDVAAQILGSDPADDAALEAALKTFGVALLADIKAKKKTDKLGHDYSRDVHDLFEGLNNRRTVRKVGLPKMTNGNYIQQYSIHVDKSDVSTFSLTDQAFATPNVIGDTPTTGGGGGGEPTNTNSDSVQKLKTDADLLFKNSTDIIGYHNLLTSSAVNARDRLTRGVIKVGIELSKQARDAAAAAVAANEPNAAQAQEQAAAIRNVITLLIERHNLHVTGGTLPGGVIVPGVEGFLVDFALLDAQALPTPTTADGIIEFAKTLFFYNTTPPFLETYLDDITTVGSTPNGTFPAGGFLVEGSILYAIELYKRAKALSPNASSVATFAADIQLVVTKFNAAISGANVANSGVDGNTLKITFVP